ncbi:hypothetical protein [Pseudoalteromonas sp. ZZD1]|uniref:hypothetical protein n=1 Tax=Pseudoalteromonas sp. ZZD1 TaxID=3139395 RepID=UPI003BAB5C66
MEPTLKNVDDKTKYTVGSICESGTVIKHIYRSSPHCIVFETESGNIGWEYQDTVDVISDRAASRFYELYEQIPEDIPDTVYENILGSVCNALIVSLKASTLDECDETYNVIESRIKKLRTNYQLKSIFILFSVLLTLVYSSMSIILYSFSEAIFNMLYICISCGCIGSLFSVLQRNDKINFDAKLSKKYIFLQASFTGLLGSISGGIIYLLSKSGLALSFASDNLYSLALLSIIGGFSERMIPELFQKIDKN